MAVAAVTPAFGASPGGWVQSPGWDLFWMFSAFWASALLLTAALAFGWVPAGAVLGAGSLLIGIAHSWSTTYMVIGSQLFREQRRKNRRKYTVVPLGIVLTSLALGLAMGLGGGFPTEARTPAQWLWVVYLGLFWVGHFWHFGNQDFGVLSIYRLKAGQISLRERRIDRSFATVMMFIVQPVVYLRSVATSPLSETFFAYVPIPRSLVEEGATVGIAAAIVLTAIVVSYELRKQNTSIPKLLYYAVMLAHPSVLYLVHYKLGFFYLISYFWSHWFIAIGLVGRVNINFQRGRGFTTGRAVLHHAMVIGLIGLIVWGFYHNFQAYSVFSGGHYMEVLARVAPQYLPIVGLILGVFLAEQLLHYYCDRCLFRFRDAGIRKTIGPLI